MKLYVRASDLRVGDIIVTSIGKAPILSVDRTHGGVELVIDLGSNRCTRPGNQGSVLWLWPHQQARVERKTSKRAA